MKLVPWCCSIALILAVIGCENEQRPLGTSPSKTSDLSSNITSTETLASVQVIRARLTPFTTAQGEPAQMVLTDWKNTGSVALRAVYADTIPFDADGNELESGARDYTIYAVSSSNPGIAPGQTYIEPDGEGYVLLPGMSGGKQASRVTVRISRVKEASNL